jgi:hypothetical protein
MRAYDPKQPLIFIHIPKAAGTATRKVFQDWYGTGFLKHYFNEQDGTLPPRHDIFKLHRRKRPVVVYGHFNRQRGFGVEDYYPAVRQFVTILRDPFELTISAYFYARQDWIDWKDPARIPREKLRDHLATARPNMLNHFPREMRLDNYRDIIEAYFVDIGIAEQLDPSMTRIAAKLGFRYDRNGLGPANTTPRDQAAPDDLREVFAENNRLEFEVYKYVRQRHDQQAAAAGLGLPRYLPPVNL